MECRFIQISCLAFSEDGNYLATSSSTETVHVFKLTESSSSEQQPPEEVTVRERERVVCHCVCVYEREIHMLKIKLFDHLA